MAPKSPRTRPPARGTKSYDYIEQDGTRTRVEIASNRTRPTSRAASQSYSGQSLSNPPEVPRTLRESPPSPSYITQDFYVNGPQNRGDASEILRRVGPTTYGTDTTDTSNTLQTVQTAPASTFYGHSSSYPQRRAFSDEHHHYGLSPLPQPQDGGRDDEDVFLPLSPSETSLGDQEPQPDSYGNFSNRNWPYISDWSSQNPNELNSFSSSAFRAVPPAQRDAQSQQTRLPAEYSTSARSFGDPASVRALDEQALSSLNQQLEDTTVGRPDPIIEETADVENLPPTTTVYETDVIVNENGRVETHAKIVPDESATSEVHQQNRESSLRPNFQQQKHHREFFVYGKVFKVWWAEPGGSYSQGATIITDNLNERVATKVRWFVVIRPGELHAGCLPIQTYESKGVGKVGVNKSEHAIIHNCSDPPSCKQREQPQGMEAPMKRPIRVRPTKLWHKIDPMSRINYRKVYTVEHNVKAADFGMVLQEDLYLLEASFRDIWFPNAPLGPPQQPLTSMPYGPVEPAALAGIGAHSQYQQTSKRNDNLDEDLGSSQNLVSGRPNAPFTPGMDYGDISKGTGRESGRPEINHPPYTSQTGYRHPGLEQRRYSRPGVKDSFCTSQPGYDSPGTGQRSAPPPGFSSSYYPPQPVYNASGYDQMSAHHAGNDRSTHPPQLEYTPSGGAPTVTSFEETTSAPDDRLNPRPTRPLASQSSYGGGKSQGKNKNRKQ